MTFLRSGGVTPSLRAAGAVSPCYNQNDFKGLLA